MITVNNKFASDFIRGINMGNMLECETEGAWGTRVEDEYFALIKGKGFDFVRIPIRWNAHTNENDIIYKEFFDRIDHVLGEAMKNNLHIVMNIHHFNELNKDPEKYEQKLYRIWQQLAEHYKGFPYDVVFEVNNEPNGKLNTERWNPMQLECIKIIRATDTERKIMISGGDWGGYSGLYTVDYPKDDKNLIASFHFYDPFRFTHQGASWSPGTKEYLGTTWRATEQEQKDITAVFEKVEAWSKKTGLPVFLGEFGAYEKADMESRIIWTAFVSEQAEKYGFAWCYWEFNSGFGIYDPKNKVFRDGLVKSLVGRPR